jgi:hypothetical protein
LASVKTGSWVQVFYAMVACDVLAALLALFWLKPVANRTIERGAEMQRLEEEAAAAAKRKPAMA